MTLTSPEAWRLLPMLQQAPGGPGECMWLRDRQHREVLKGTRSSIIYCHFLVTKDLNKTHSHLHGVSGLSVRQPEAAMQKTENGGFQQDVTQHTLGGGRRGPRSLSWATCGPVRSS